jgi:hypothetical protein
LKAFHTVYLDNTKTARTNWRKISMVAEMRDVYSPIKGSLQYTFPFLRFDISAVYDKPDRFHNLFFT